MPARRMNNILHLRIQKNHICIVSPWTAQIGLSAALRLAGNTAIGKHISPPLFLRRRSSRDIAGFQTMNLTSLKKRRPAAENEIAMTRDIAILVIMPSAMVQQRILPTQKTAPAKDAAVTEYRRCRRLAHRSGTVLKGQIFRRKIISTDSHRRSSKGADFFAVFIPDAGIQMIGKNRGLCILADHSNKSLALRHNHALLIGARLNKNLNRFIVFRRQRINCGLNRRIIGTSIRTDGKPL